MPELFTRGSLVGASVAMGLMAGLFYAWSVSVMPGLARTDDRTYLVALRAMNRAITNGWFFLCFAGAPLLTVVAALARLGTDHNGELAWILAGLGLYVAVLAITGAVHLPLNNRLDATVDADRPADLAALRARFQTTWVRWNTVRAVLNTAALGCLLVALEI